MGRIDGTNARVRVIIGIHTETKGPRAPHGSSAPVIVVVLETVHLFGQTFLFELGLLPQLPFLLLQPLFLQSSPLFSRDFFLVLLCICIGLAVTLVASFQRTV